MKFKSLSLSLLLLIFTMLVFNACAEKKSEKEPEKVEENIEGKSDMVAYQCPMDCEEGKTYHEAGSCPVCKMDLKEVDGAKAMNCKKDKDGNCSCKEGACQCDDCAKHTAMNCTKDEDGNCSCKKGECQCENCAEHS